MEEMSGEMSRVEKLRFATAVQTLQNDEPEQLDAEKDVAASPPE